MRRPTKPRIPTELISNKIRPPLAIVMGTPGEVSTVLEAVPRQRVVCYQMDLYPAERLREKITETRLEAEVVTAPDLWELPPEFQSVLYIVPQGGERALKLDLVEQAFHILRMGGTFLISSPYAADTFFPPVIKKVFGAVHASVASTSTLFWSRRNETRPRRRHEVVFQAKLGDAPSLQFLSRPGVFSHGRLDDGARALIETMEIAPGGRVLDLGCGCGTNGVFAGLASGPRGHVTFVDSNVRAVALAERNARLNGVPNFQALATPDARQLGRSSFEVVLANPPYYAYESIARMFIETGRDVLRTGGRFYLVTKQAERLTPWVSDAFPDYEVFERRGYAVIVATR
jgi:16S rRNA (guanine1207-N2)-methyltransferase